MFDFNKCRPIKLDDLVRVGNSYDGGYILSKRQIEKTDTVLSFGVNDDWTFEEDFAKRKNVKIYSYDYSTKDLPFMKQDFKMNYAVNYAGIAYNIFRLKRSKVLHHINHIREQKRYIAEQKELNKRFMQFFDETKERFFIPKFIGQYDDETNICFETIFKRLGIAGEEGNLSVFLKMDIEGGEYLCLPQIMPFLSKLNGMTIEFHNLAVVDIQFEKLLDAFLYEFYVAHTHGNNNSGLIYKTNVPEVLEITFIHKKLVSENVVSSRCDYPIEGLDAPCNKFKEDYKLTFTTG